MNTLNNWIFLSFIVGIPTVALLKKVDIFESFTNGAKDGFHIAIKIIPSLVAILIAIGMFRAAGGFDILTKILGPLLKHLDFPQEILPLALIRPFSGSAANGMLAELAHKYGGDSSIAHLGATIVGSTETTFYVIAIYFGAIAIKRTRYAITAGLFADFIGVVAAVMLFRAF